MYKRGHFRGVLMSDTTQLKRRTMNCRSYISAVAVALCVTLTANPASAHQVGNHTAGSEPSGLPGVHTCANFEWTKKRRCSTYDSTDHRWEVTNNCPRDVKLQWADNAFNSPIRRDEESGKPRSESIATVRPGKTYKGEIDCVDKAEIEICIAFVYPPLQEHAKVDCDDFFHR